MSCWMAWISARSTGSSLDGASFLSRELAPFVAPHRLESGSDDLVGALTSRRAQLEEQVAGAGLDLDGGGVGHSTSLLLVYLPTIRGRLDVAREGSHLVRDVGSHWSSVY